MEEDPAEEQASSIGILPVLGKDPGNLAAVV